MGRAFPCLEDLTQAQPAAEPAHSSPLSHHKTERRHRASGPGRSRYTGNGDVSGEEDTALSLTISDEDTCTSLSQPMVTEALGMQEKLWTTSGAAGMAGNRKTRNYTAPKTRAKGYVVVSAGGTVSQKTPPMAWGEGRPHLPRALAGQGFQEEASSVRV